MSCHPGVSETELSRDFPSWMNFFTPLVRVFAHLPPQAALPTLRAATDPEVEGGAISHVVVDLLNVSGVRLLLPFSEKVCVLFSRQFRFPVASRTELGWLVAFVLLAWFGTYLNELGGIRAAVGVVTGSPRLAYQRYLKQGTRICFLEGQLRHIDGRIEDGNWLVVGQEGKEKFAIWDEDEQIIIHLPSQAEFLSVNLKVKDEHWQTLAITGWATTKKPSFFYDGRSWKFAATGSVVFGRVIARELEVETVTAGGTPG